MAVIRHLCVPFEWHWIPIRHWKVFQCGKLDNTALPLPRGFTRPPITVNIPEKGVLQRVEWQRQLRPADFHSWRSEPEVHEQCLSDDDTTDSQYGDDMRIGTNMVEQIIPEFMETNAAEIINETNNDRPSGYCGATAWAEIFEQEQRKIAQEQRKITVRMNKCRRLSEKLTETATMVVNKIIQSPVQREQKLRQLVASVIAATGVRPQMQISTYSRVTVLSFFEEQCGVVMRQWATGHESFAEALEGILDRVARHQCCEPLQGVTRRREKHSKHVRCQ